MRSRYALAMAILLVGAVSCNAPTVQKETSQTSTSSDGQRWSRRLQCREVAQAKLASDEVRQQEAVRRGEHRLLMFAPEYCYHEALNTCICDEHWIGDVYEYRAVIDLLNGRKLAEFRTGMGGPANRQELSEQQEFEAARQKLFAGCAK